MEARQAIWNEKLQRYHKLEDDNELKETLFHWESTLTEEYAVNLAKYIRSKGWCFVYIIDNIDHFEDVTIYQNSLSVQEIIDFCFTLTNYPIPSLVIAVARVDSVYQSIQYFADRYQNLKVLNNILRPNFEEVFEKRLEYISEHIDKGYGTIKKKHHASGLVFPLTKAEIIKTVINYLLTYSPNRPQSFIIADLANFNIRQIVQMILSILETHIDDITDTPIQSLLTIKHKSEDAEDYYFSQREDRFLQSHLTVWALGLKNNYLYYKDDPSRSWLDNIYGVKDRYDSYFLKLLIIDYFTYKKENEQREKIDLNLLSQVFVQDMGFPISMFNAVLNELISRERAPFLSVEEVKLVPLYKLTPKGEIYSNYLSSLFTYYELVVEDTFMPKLPKYDFKLVPYEPLSINKKELRGYKQRYFEEKKKQVIAFMDFLECREKYERELYNNFRSKSDGFFKNYFPGLRVKINEQMEQISSSLMIK